MIDYHLHTKRCHHAAGEIEEYLAFAQERGLLEIGFADHFPLELLNYTPKNEVTMAGEELEEYIGDISSLSKESSDVVVRLGAEIDYLPGQEALTRQLISSYPFDYVIGSIHFLDNWDFTHPAQAKKFEAGCIKSIYRKYFEQLKKMVTTRLFDIVGHADVVKKFGYRLEEKEWQIILPEIVAAIKQADICVEVNTSGWRSPAAEQYPSRSFLEACFQNDIPVTLGSDAHLPEDVGKGLEEAITLLREIGYRRLALFSHRQRYYMTL